jgi:hypothetical protein
MESNLRDVAEVVEHEELSRIRLSKIEEITKAWDDLFFVLAGKDVFKKIPGISDYSSFEKSMRQSLEEASHYLPEEPITTPPPGDLLNQLGELLSVDYVPPQDGKGMAVDLIRLREYYRVDFLFPSIETALDLSLCKLIGSVKKLCAIAVQKGERELTRTKRTNKTRKDDKDKRKVFVIAIYDHGITIEAGTKLSRVCAAIKDQFNDWKGKEGYWGTIPKDMHIPSRDSIKRWLKEEGILDRDFMPKGSYWIKQT